MTKNANFKRRVRTRAAKTGESYTAARKHLVRESATERTTVCLAVAQSTLRTDPNDAAGFRASGQEMRRLMQNAHEAGADLLHFPEGAICWPDKRLLSESGPESVGPADWGRFAWAALRQELEAIRLFAAHLGLWVVIGSVHALTQPQRPHNSLYVISDEGKLVTRYDERLLSNTKISFMYSPGAEPITFTINGLRFGCALGMESHFPEVFTEYEQLDVDCVLFSTTGGSAAYPNDSAFTAEVLGHAASNSIWVSYAVPVKSDETARSGIVTPFGQWGAQCAGGGTPSIALCEIDDHGNDPARPWRRSARSGIYDPHRVANDPRSDRRDAF